MDPLGGYYLRCCAIFSLSLSLSLSFFLLNKGPEGTNQYMDSSYMVPKNPLPVLIHTNCIVKEPTVNWWRFYSGSFMKTADSLKYSKPTTNQRVFFILK
jgi:hypothetical protein